MTEMEQRVAALVSFYRQVETKRMQGIPILNPALSVEAVGFRPADADETVSEGVLITPWFMSRTRLMKSPTAHREAETAKAHRG